MAQYEFIYFPVRGRGESIRLLLEDNELEYKEIGCGPREKWISEYKPQMPFGQVPCVKDGDFLMVQMNAILRHLARKHGLYGSSDQEATLIDMLNDATDDLRIKYTRMIYQNYEEGKQPFIDSLPQELGFLENYVKKNGDPQSGFGVGKKKTYVDYNLTDLLDALQTLSPKCLQDFPSLAQLFEANITRPPIAKYRNTEGFKTRPINGNGKQ